MIQQKSSGSKQHVNNAFFGQQKSKDGSQLQQQSSVSKPNQVPFYPSNQPNIFTHPNQQKPQTELISTGYKMTQNQPVKKQFPSSS